MNLCRCYTIMLTALNGPEVLARFQGSRVLLCLLRRGRPEVFERRDRLWDGSRIMTRDRALNKGRLSACLYKEAINRGRASAGSQRRQPAPAASSQMYTGTFMCWIMNALDLIIRQISAAEMKLHLLHFNIRRHWYHILNISFLVCITHGALMM